MKIGIDLGGTKTEGILIDSMGKELIRQRVKTQKNYEGTIDGIKSIVNDFENKFGETLNTLPTENWDILNFGKNKGHKGTYIKPFFITN